MKDGKVAVLEWLAWEGFLLAHVLGDDAERIKVDPFCELPSRQFDRICASFPTVCFQINLSLRNRLPLRIRDLTNRFVERGVFVVNGFVQDIRKSTLQTHLETIGLNSVKVTPSGPSHEVLIVKTDLNFGGEPERMARPESIAVGGLEHLVSPEIRGAYQYKTVLRDMLPAEIWNDPSIMIEKYVSNSEDSFYRVYFSGERVIIVKAFAPGVIKKLSTDPRDTNYVTDLEHLKAGTDELEISETLKRDLVTFLEQSAIEFGCLDIMHDGNDNHYIVDLNLTPYAGTKPIDPFLTNFLREGFGTPPQRNLSDFVASPLIAVAD
jgi:hypothetical protein